MSLRLAHQTVKILLLLLLFTDIFAFGGEPMKLTSSAFREGGPIPTSYTCDGEDISPPLAWENVPENTQSLALMMDDPDAPGKTWVHWVLFNLRPETRELLENFNPQKDLPYSVGQGRNDFGNTGYGGPCPPGGKHRYYFKLYALDTILNLPTRSSKADLLKAMEGHILAQVELVGTYER